MRSAELLIEKSSTHRLEISCSKVQKAALLLGLIFIFFGALWNEFNLLSRPLQFVPFAVGVAYAIVSIIFYSEVAAAILSQKIFFVRLLSFGLLKAISTAGIIFAAAKFDLRDNLTLGLSLFSVLLSALIIFGLVVVRNRSKEPQIRS